jgi:hypothetical protein
MILAATSGCGLLVSTSSALEPAKGVLVSSPAMEWKAGVYKVTFRGGPMANTDEQRSFSCYEITRQMEGHTYPLTQGVESATSNHAFPINGRTGDYIRLFTSPSGKTLLIEERVPNDCAPCTNWILVTGKGSSLVHDYLDLPTRAVNPADFDSEFPTITKVTEKEISFQYSDGTKRTMAVKDLVKKEKRPTFPG